MRGFISSGELIFDTGLMGLLKFFFSGFSSLLEREVTSHRIHQSEQTLTHIYHNQKDPPKSIISSVTKEGPRRERNFSLLNEILLTLTRHFSTSA